MFLQDTPPDTSGYMIAGYVVFFAMAAIYLVSLMVRSRNLKQDLATLESMQKENPNAMTGAPKPPSPKAGKPRTARSRTVKKKATRKK